MGFSCRPPSLVVPVCVWGSFWGGGAVSSFSPSPSNTSCSVSGRLLLSLFWCGFYAPSWGACGFPRRFLPLVTLSGFRNLSGSSWLAYSCSGDLLLGWRCLWCTTWFSTLCRALPPGPAVCAASPAAAYPWGVFAFSVTGCLTYCCFDGIGWAATLTLYFCASPAPAGLQGFAGFCTLCQGAPVGVVSALCATV